jgi:hypothetical protein
VLSSKTTAREITCTNILAWKSAADYTRRLLCLCAVWCGFYPSKRQKKKKKEEANPNATNFRRLAVFPLSLFPVHHKRGGWVGGIKETSPLYSLLASPLAPFTHCELLEFYLHLLT